MSDIRQPSDYYRELTYGSANPFISARLKLKRAKRHLLEAENTARDLPHRQGRNFVFGADQKTGKAQIIFIGHSNMPMEFAGVVGDVIHNLRSTLDHVAVVLATPPIGTGNPRHAYFPTGIDRDTFITARDGFTKPSGKRVKGKMEGAPTDALRMVEELEPYDGGKHSLRALHDLDILDKHKLIIPTISKMTINRFCVSIGEQTFSLGATDFKSDGDGFNLTALIDCPVDPSTDFKFNNDFEAAFEIVFAKDQPLGGERIVETLSKIADTCQGFIEACEAHFLTRNP